MYAREINFPKAEEEVLRFWKSRSIFERCKEESKDRKRYIFYDGPPFATGLPHYGHILSGTVKDTVGRFAFQQGHRVDRRFGWDCHGLPVEYEIDKKLGITNRQQVLDMGIDKYNGECRSIVMKYSKEWEEIVERMGRWADFEGGYRTMDKSFMESTWFVFKKLFERNKIYRGYKVMPFSTACKTPLSNFEANQNYKDVSDPSVLISFPLLELFKGRKVELVAWTTTPWTLPANCMLAVSPEYKYALINHKNRFLVVHEDRVAFYFKDSELIELFSGSELVGLFYTPPFSCYDSLCDRGFFKVTAADFVTPTNGTAIVHIAPAFGEDDYKACVEAGLIKENEEVPCPIDENGCFTLEPYTGTYFKELDKLIIRDLRERVLMNGRIVHSYPFCWRSDTPLLYRLVPNWFIRVREEKEALLRGNELINWVPEDIKYKRFHNWLEQCRDWAVGRNRFWGTPIPIWVAETDDSDVLCVGSVKELETLSGTKVTDLHREFVDSLVINKDGKKYKRVEEVLDCWFESGAMPYAQDHWPFSECELSLSNLSLHDTLTKKNFPADFIGEGLDQTRGWFYTLHVLSTILFGKPAFKNVLVFGIVLAEDGRKMSKRLKNYPDPQVVISKCGADSLRLYLLSSPVVLADNLRFSEAGVVEITKTLLIPWYNSLSFYMECKDKSVGELESAVHVLDCWIVASFNTFCYEIVKAVKSFHLNTILPLSLRFIGDLSNWYIRIGRKRLRGDNGILGRLLIEFSTVMAPFVPFFSEYSYKSVTGSSTNWPESVHLRMCPEGKRMEHSFELARTVIEAVRQMREKLKIKFKRPIKSARIVISEEYIRILDGFRSLITEECNFLELLYEAEEKYKYEMSIKPCFESMKSDKDKKKKINIIRSLSEQQIKELQHGSLIADGVEINRSDVLLEQKFLGVDSGNIVSEMFMKYDPRIASFSSERSSYDVNFGIILDTGSDEKIEKLAAAREFYSFVQRQRKTAKLKVEDDVSVWVDDGYITEAVKETYPDMKFGKNGVLVSKSECSHEGRCYEVALYRNTN